LQELLELVVLHYGKGKVGGDQEGDEGVGDFTGVLGIDRLTGNIA